MVKGVAKQAVILQPNDRSGFEQAIFILSPDGQGQKIGSAEEMLELADEIVAEYTVPSLGRRKKPFWPCAISFLLGSGLTAAGFVLTVFF